MGLINAGKREILGLEDGVLMKSTSPAMQKMHSASQLLARETGVSFTELPNDCVNCLCALAAMFLYSISGWLWTFSPRFSTLIFFSESVLLEVSMASIGEWAGSEKGSTAVEAIAFTY
jgi:hypothetical protein